MRKKLVAGNWKMNLTGREADLLACALARHGYRAEIDVLLLPAFVHLAQVRTALAGSQVKMGAQDLCASTPGAFTGAVSGEMLTDIGCEYVLVGHSERRQIFAEPDDLVAEKFARAIACGLKPILCVGETLAERDAGSAFAVITRQLDAVLTRVGISGFNNNAAIAYEPVWAIGTGRTATPEQAQEVHVYLRSQIAAHSAKVAGLIQILYGGSVKSVNAKELLSMADIDGALVGGAALNAFDFQEIIAAA
jgi:triosephosphate isomerase (TIM)